jgi:hypothetical protein
VQTSDSIGTVLRQYARLRFQQFSSTALRDLSAPSDAFCIIPLSYLRFLSQNARPVCQWLDECLNGKSAPPPGDAILFFSDNMIRYLHNKNQFICIGRGAKENLAALYHAFLTDFRNALEEPANPFHLQRKLRQVFASHQFDLEQFVRDLAPANTDFVFSEPVCSEYSPALQLALLHAQIEHCLNPSWIWDVDHKAGSFTTWLNMEKTREALIVPQDPMRF